MKGSRLSERCLIYGWHRQSARNIPASEKEWTSDLLCMLRRRELFLLLKYIFVVSKKFFACAFFFFLFHFPPTLHVESERAEKIFMFEKAKGKREKKTSKNNNKVFFHRSVKAQRRSYAGKGKARNFFHCAGCECVGEDTLPNASCLLH